MVKVPSTVEGVYMVGPEGGKLRPWCGKCHKFLKSENASHDCTPVDLKAARHRAASLSKETKNRKFRMTKNRKKQLLGLIKDAAYERVLHKNLNSIARSKSDKAIIKAAKELKKALAEGEKKSLSETANKMYTKFFK